MNGYIALKTMTLSGVEYTAGATIPAEAVLPSRAPSLVRNKYIATMNENTLTPPEPLQNEQKEVDGVTLPIQTENGVLELPVSREDITKAVEVLQMKAEDGAKAVSEIESEDALIIIDACTTLKTVKSAIKARVEEISKEPEGDPDEGGDE